MKFLFLFFLFTPKILFGKNLFNTSVFLYGFQEKFPITNAEQTQKNSPQFDRRSENLFLFGVNDISHNENWGYDFNFQVIFQENKATYFLGDNAYLYFKIWNTDLTFGRKKFFNKKIFLSWIDGTEGLGIFYETKFWKIQVNLLDYYRAYPSFEKNFLLNQESPKGHRFRHSAEICFENENHFFGFSFYYLNLGNWGRYSKEVLNSHSGDRDFLYEVNLQYVLNYYFFQWGVGLHLLKGLDKTQTHEIRKGASLPFSGELVTTKLGFHFDLFSLEMRGLLPDRHKTNKQGEILESGYIGMGNYPFRGVLIGQYLQYYPSAWITQKGLVFEENILQGFHYSFLGEVEISIKSENWNFHIFVSNLTPYKMNGTEKGTLRANREEFSKLFLNEYGTEFLYKPIAKNFFFSLFVSSLATSKEIGYTATLAYLKGGILF